VQYHQESGGNAAGKGDVVEDLEDNGFLLSRRTVAVPDGLGQNYDKGMPQV